MDKLRKWFTSFVGALLMAVFCFSGLIQYIVTNSVFMAWWMGLGTLTWLYVARLALKAKRHVKPDVQLTPDQETRIKEATENLNTVMKEVELELVQAVRERFNESNKRKDQEAGTEGADGRADSEEDRTP